MEPVALDIPPALRELTAAEAPFAGVLRAGDPPTVWVDAAAFGASPAWAAHGAEHLLAPMDAAGTPEGSRVVLPHCPVRLDEVLTDGSPPPGVLVTLAVSALRGAREADGLGAEAGRWWVTTEGRPVLALTGTLAWREDTVDLLRRVYAADPPLQRALESAAAAIGDPRLLRREGEAIEGALFAAADPEPLPTERREDGHLPKTRERAVAPPRASGSVAGTVRDLLARLVDVGVAERVGRAWAAVVRRTRATPRAGDRQAGRPTGGRRRVLLVAAAVATAVIVGGALWPSGEGERPAAAAGGSADPTRAAAPSASASPVRDEDPATEDAARSDEGPAEIVDAARGLVDALAACGDDACLEKLWEESGSARPIDAAGGDYAVEVVDEYGGAAAVRIVTAEVTQVLVMVRVEKRWLVREVYDLADQP
ncbi:hypothetical protein Q9S36_01565 [Microbacterium sp. ARD31]|uniref:hypothetical protein n=1 Tax=Microbacterium sp. ARD31 TaxID=2962576 RepID=UPI0028829AA5|nr:hypothetical protein [Microbacterium sp. ARD31]MDT0178900.1 hypothetical protein [Microbacterium sp. ARD31]